MKESDFSVRETAHRYPDHARLLTYEDYRKTPPGQRYELVEGVLRRMDAPTTVHQDVLRRLERRLYDQLQATGRGRIYQAPVDVVLSNHDVVQPDLLYVAADRLNIITRANVVSAPDLVVEVLSPSTTQWDRQTKRRVYAKYGAREYWLVDTEAETVEVAALVAQTPEPAELQTTGVHAAGDRVRSQLLPEIVIEVAELFEDDFGPCETRLG
jgi:Uma2 family endonuclease